MTELWDRVAAFAGTAAVLAGHADAVPQVDQLCGPFWARLALLLLSDAAEQLPSQVEAAKVAGTRVHPGLDSAVRPPGQPAHRAGWDELPHTAEPGLAGTSGRELADAIADLSAGRLVAVPVLSPGVELGRLLSAISTVPALVIANIDTSALWGSHAEPALLQHFLDTGEDTAGPAPDWRVGHFAALWGRNTGVGGTLVAVADTYPSLGTDARHLQPLPRVARALSDRGLLITVAAENAAATDAAVREVGLTTGLWD
ncbi:hypothetical protein [Mycolicibacterium bacteremicum]|uniref:DUF6885 family protein n=1 Tax=Mycolicibacterium bacteremicum TaxID=564198 RepID=UPI0026E975FA|nr:hypothetical protein [Mycolicibacterium bacteremicum]